jgi:hypothetical protein
VQGFDTSGRYGDAAVIAALQGVSGARTLDFRYEQLDRFNHKLADITGMITASVSQDASADVKRTAQFVLRDGYDAIDYLSDRIKPYVRLQMPDNGWVEWPQGVYLLSSPTKSLATNGEVTRSVEAYDQLVVISADAVSDRYSIPAGQRFAAAIGALLDGSGITAAITPSDLALPVTWDYEAGTSKLTILTDMLSAMNYRSPWFDESGTLICEPYVLPVQRGIGYTYATDSTSMIVGQVDQSYDLFNIPNKWTLVVSDTDQGSFSSTFINSDPTSPTSTVSRGRTIMSFDSGQSAADQATLDALVKKTAYESSQVYESVAFSSGLMPFHSNADIIAMTVGDLTLSSAKFEELSWSMDLKVGGSMSHTVRRIISTVGS